MTQSDSQQKTYRVVLRHATKAPLKESVNIDGIEELKEVLAEKGVTRVCMGRRSWDGDEHSLGDPTEPEQLTEKQFERMAWKPDDEEPSRVHLNIRIPRSRRLSRDEQ